MCGSMVDIQSATAEIRRGKKNIEDLSLALEDRRRNHGAKIQWPAVFHRAATVTVEAIITPKRVFTGRAMRCTIDSNSVRPSACLSVCPPHVGIVSKLGHVALCTLHCRTAKCV